jgi:uncharacterized protein
VFRDTIRTAPVPCAQTPILMLPALTSLVALQQLDTAAETARRRLSEHPAALQAIDRRIAEGRASVEVAKAALAANHLSRRELEKQVAAIDTRLARFDDHRAAVKTNQEYSALLHEIETAKSEKETVEEQILVLMEAGDELQALLKETEAALAKTSKDADAARAALTAERTTLEADIARLMTEKATQAAHVDKVLLARYEQLLKARKMVAVAEMKADMCLACHVRLRPAVTQQVRRGTDIVTCDSCQRILYSRPEAAASAPDAAPPAH